MFVYEALLQILYDVRSEDILTLAVHLVHTEPGESGFKYYSAYKQNAKKSL